MIYFCITSSLLPNNGSIAIHLHSQLHSQSHHLQQYLVLRILSNVLIAPPNLIIINYETIDGFSSSLRLHEAHLQAMLKIGQDFNLRLNDLAFPIF